MPTTSTSVSSAPSVVHQTQNQTKRTLYIKIFKQEFIRELEFAWDVASGRAEARDDFATKIAALLKNGSPKIPGIGDAIDKLASAVEFAANAVRDKAMHTMASIYEQLDLQRLEILLEVVAREAYRRYEFFIEQRLTDDHINGVIPFAKIGVMRVLEYLARKRNTLSSEDTKQAADNKNNQQIELTESFLLAGLVEGYSGAFVQGWSNNKVKLKRFEKNFLGKTQAVEIEIEDVYARSAFMWFDVKSDRLNQTVYMRSSAWHKEISGWQKLKQLSQGNTEALYNFGYVKMDSKNDPLCGYAVMPLKVITERYDFKPAEDKQFSRDFKSELENKTLSVVQIDNEGLKRYVIWYRENLKRKENTVADYLRVKEIWRGAKWVICQEDLTGVDLKGVNLSQMDLSGAILSGDLTGTNFAESYLIGATFRNVKAQQANFQNAHCAFLCAEKTDFTGANFTQANFSYAKLAQAVLINVQSLGTIWHQADLSNVKGNEQLLKAQQEQLQKLTEQTELQRKEMREFGDALAQQQKKLVGLCAQLDAKISQALQPDSKDTAQLQEVNDQIQQLAKQQEASLLFERSCQDDIKRLQQALQSSAKKEEVDKLRQEANELKEQFELMRQQLKNASKTKNSQVPQQMPEELESHVVALSTQYPTLTQDVRKIHGEVQQELQMQMKQQDERFSSLELQLGQVEKKLSQRIEQVENKLEAQRNINAFLARSNEKSGKQTDIEIKSLRAGLQSVNAQQQAQQSSQQDSARLSLFQLINDICHDIVYALEEVQQLMKEEEQHQQSANDIKSLGKLKGKIAKKRQVIIISLAEKIPGMTIMLTRAQAIAQHNDPIILDRLKSTIEEIEDKELKTALFNTEIFSATEKKQFLSTLQIDEAQLKNLKNRQDELKAMAAKLVTEENVYQLILVASEWATIKTQYETNKSPHQLSLREVMTNQIVVTSDAKQKIDPNPNAFFTSAAMLTPSTASQPKSVLPPAPAMPESIVQTNKVGSAGVPATAAINDQLKVAAQLIAKESLEQDYQQALSFLKTNKPLSLKFAFNLFENLALQHNYPKAIFQLALAYQVGSGCQKDLAKAFKLYKQAAEEHNQPAAMIRLAAFYQGESGVELDNEKVVAWNIRATHYKLSTQTFALACHNLGTIYLNGLYGVTKDEKIGFDWYRQSVEADEDQLDSLYRLAQCYEKGCGCPVDNQLAGKWYQKAADKGYSSAQKKLNALPATSAFGSVPHTPSGNPATAAGDADAKTTRAAAVVSATATTSVAALSPL